MNWRQLRAILSLRWQLSRNQWLRAGALNALLMAGGAALLTIVAVGAFFGTLIGGSLLLSDLESREILILWDVVAGAFLGCWLIGLMTELQRSELLSLDKLLHLPVSLSGAFLLNYFSSWFSLSLVLFVPAWAGLSLAFVITRGASMLLLGPLVFGFVVMITGVAYQFRGWLAQLMQSKRRRGTILASMTIGFLLLMQAPNLINLVVFRNFHQARVRQQQAEHQRFSQLAQELQNNQITVDEFNRRRLELEQQRSAARELQTQSKLSDAIGWLRFANLILPVGWLPFGAASLSEGRYVPPLLCALGMSALGGASLWRAYRATLRMQTRNSSAAPRPSARSVTAAVPKPLLVARAIPGLSEQVAAVALTSFCSILRSAEAKLMLLAPLMFLCMFASMMILGPKEAFPREATPLVLFVGIGITSFSVSQFLSNSFGLDRSGFRSYILMPVARRDILLGKNLSLLPLVFGLSGLAFGLSAIIFPVRISHVLAAFVQTLNAYLLISLAGNFLSIRFPFAMPAAGSLRPHNVQWVPFLMQMLLFFAISIALLPAIVAGGLEFLLEMVMEQRWIPWCLLMSLGETVLIVLVYFQSLEELGKLLQSRETRILETIAAANE